MPPNSAQKPDRSALPVIDIAGLRRGDRDDCIAVAAQLRAACLDKGFFYISGHGIAADTIAAVFAASREFFALPEQDKLAVHMQRSFCNRGYEPLRAQTLEAGTPPDLKEGFYSGNDLPLGDPRVVARQFNQGPNQWPVLLGFREALESYFSQMLELAAVVMQGLALSLRLAPNHFDAFCTDAMATLRLLHYPPQPANPEPGEKGCGAHTDFGGITLLAQDDVGGLQVWDARAGWIHAPPLPGTFVVNLGDMIARWTNDRYRSTLHRVVTISGRERYSIPFFYSGNPGHTVSCLPTCLDAGEAPHYPPITVGAHLAGMYRQTYAI